MGVKSDILAVERWKDLAVDWMREMRRLDVDVRGLRIN